MESNNAVAHLSALAQESRLSVFRLLVQAGQDGMAAGDLAARLKLPNPTLSFHLAQLKNAGLVQSRRESRSLIYSANFPAMNALVAYLTENCCGGQACLPAAACVPEQPKIKAKRRA
jgi:ArsR family transcriptional regulator